MCDVIPMDAAYLATVAKQRPSPRSNWNDAVDALVYFQRSAECSLDDCLTRAHLETDPTAIARIASVVREIEVHAAATHYAIVEWEEKMRKRGA